MSLQVRSSEVRQRIETACKRSGRALEEVQVVAVTKYVSLDRTQEALSLGYHHLGESRWQDAREKWQSIGDAAQWHFIGHLQTNKVKDVIGRFAYIHSLDRLSLAQELQRKAEQLDLTVNCFLQLNISGEESKYGLAPEELAAFCEQLIPLDRLKIIGLMTMAPYESEPEQTRSVFRGLREIRDLMNERNYLPYSVVHLSMGMSNDFEVAIEEGATWIRLGSILVGQDEDEA